MPTTSRAVKGQVREVQVQSSVLGRLVIVVEIYLGPAAFERYRKIGDADSHACVVLTAPSPTCGVLTVLPTVQKTEPAMLTEKNRHSSSAIINIEKTSVPLELKSNPQSNR